MSTNFSGVDRVPSLRSGYYIQNQPKRSSITLFINVLSTTKR
jgi:hypothetical protein